jgi:ATP-dependent Lon protease
MATAILSAFTHKPVKKSVAMTGEITLRGKVLPIGGLKEKTLAAYRLGIRDIIIPADNKKDLEDIPENVRSNINFIPVTEVDTVFKNAIIGV